MTCRYCYEVDECPPGVCIRDGIAPSKSPSRSVMARPISEWTEEDGNVLWWCFPITEAPYCGSPLDVGRTCEITLRLVGEEHVRHTDIGGWPGYHTHWTPIPYPEQPTRLDLKPCLWEEEHLCCYPKCNCASDREPDKLQEQNAEAVASEYPKDDFGAHILTESLGRIGDREIGLGHVVLSEARYEWLMARAARAPGTAARSAETSGLGPKGNGPVGESRGAHE